MKNLAYTILLLMSLGLSACSSPAQPQKAAVTEEKPEPPAAAGSALYVYQTHNQTNSPSLTLYMGAEPSALAVGYVRLVGVVGQIILLEIGGRGALVGVGDRVGEYVVQNISESEVKLCSRK